MKKQTILALSVMTLSCMLFNTGCAESKNDSTESKNDSSTTTLRTTAFEGAQGNCNNGGVKLEVLVDGVVDDAQTQYICNGANVQSERDIHNALVATSDEVGETCANGGVHMAFGLDANDNGTLDAGEILGSRAICHGTNGENGENGQTATIHTTAFEDVQGGCNYGGIKAEVLIDNVVQADQTQYICNGANGQNGQDGRDGQDGHIALVMSSDEVGDHCSNGGIRLNFGLDTNDNALLDHEEILSFHYICNGSNGLDGQNGQDGTNGTNANIATTVFEGEQGSCMNGGVKIDVLIDGVIQTGKTQYICNGVNGADGQDGKNGANGSNATLQATAFTGTQGSCTNGGVKVDVLVDGVVQAGQTKYICNGVNGADGQDGQNGTNGTNGSNATIQTTSFTGAQGSCSNGGVKVDVLVDGVVQAGQTKYICNGANGADGQNGENGTNGTNANIQTTPFDGAQGSCSNGGVKVEVLVDGVVQPDLTQYICNGTNGQNDQILCNVNGNFITIDLTSDSANCGGCGNVCDAGFECIHSNCEPMSDMSSATIICNSQVVPAYKDNSNCGGCGNVCTLSICKNSICSNPDVGEIITFGHYEQDADPTNGKEPIEWRVLDINDEGQYLIISKKVLRRSYYDTYSYPPRVWSDSTIRSWLNGYPASYNRKGTDYTNDNFIDAAFTTEEKSMIVYATVPGYKDSQCPSTSATTDKIFLLSIYEVNRYFTDKNDRKAHGTLSVFFEYLAQEGLNCTNAVNCIYPWWLRNTSCADSGSKDYSSLAMYINSDGLSKLAFANENLFNVRPALWVKF